MEENKKLPAPKRLKKPNIVVRLLALAVTAALVLGALGIPGFGLLLMLQWALR